MHRKTAGLPPGCATAIIFCPHLGQFESAIGKLRPCTRYACRSSAQRAVVARCIEAQAVGARY
jgi:hypothetical protein